MEENPQLEQNPNEFDIDSIISQLLEARQKKIGEKIHIPIQDIIKICHLAQEIFMKQPILLELEGPLKVCGDIHGQYYDLLRIFEFIGYPPDENFLFLGDYVDRGNQNIETILLLFCFKIKYPENFFLLRGNHECETINRMYGFYDECKKRYSVKLWKKFSEVFKALPVAALIEDKILCMHGGLSPNLTNIKQIFEIKRPQEIPENGIFCDILWSDPIQNQQGWGENERGVSYTFGVDILKAFLKAQDLDLICRAHQVVEDGFEFFGQRGLVTIFSAPNYCGEFDNCAGIMCVSKDLECSFKILQPIKKSNQFENINGSKIGRQIFQ